MRIHHLVTCLVSQRQMTVPIFVTDISISVQRMLLFTCSLYFSVTSVCTSSQRAVACASNLLTSIATLLKLPG
jgi:hypothetical protein